MILLADTANLEELKLLKEMGIITGITTNPSIIAREGSDCLGILRQIRTIFPDVPLFGQVVGKTKEQMVDEAKKIHGVSKNMVVKIPATIEGMKAIAQLKQMGIATCATAVLTAAEAVICAQAGADYVAPYTGQNDIIGFKGTETLKEIAEVFRQRAFQTKILAASIEKPQEIVDYFLAGAHCITAPYSVFTAAFQSPNSLTEHYINAFNEDWTAGKCYID